MCEIFDISYGEVGIIRDLWEKNRQYHEKTSEYFKEFYRSISFDERIKGFGAFGSEDIKLTVARVDGKYIGYCISTIVGSKGEVASLHVDKAYRRSGIGRKLVLTHLEWMDGRKCKEIGVTVSHENEPTIAFYRKLGFFPDTLYMQQKIKSE